MAYYDITSAFQEIEMELLSSMSKNLRRHLGEEQAANFNWSMWQAEQLKSLELFRKENQKLFNNRFIDLNNDIDSMISTQYKNAYFNEEKEILKAIKNGFIAYTQPLITKTPEFFKFDNRKLLALLNETKGTFKDAEIAMLRKVDDMYRKIIFNAQVAYATGSMTTYQCIDIAMKDYISNGITCISYKNGNSVSLASYAEMALRTANTRATLIAQAEKRDEWGINTVIVNTRTTACPLCMRYIGKVYIDDVYSNNVNLNGNYPLLSSAIKGGLYHPNCRDTHSTYFEGITTIPKPLTLQEQKDIAHHYNLEKQQRYNERKIREYKRLEQTALDKNDIDKYHKKVVEWQNKNKEFVEDNNLRRNYQREKLRTPDNYSTNRQAQALNMLLGASYQS